MKKKILMVASLFFFLGATMAYSQSSVKMQLDDWMLEDGYSRWWGKQHKITTELMPCSPTSNVYTKIEVHRNYGIPRFGVITDCAQQTLDTVWYLPNNLVRSETGINRPTTTDTSITIFWQESAFTLKVIDVMTGNVVLNETRTGQPASLFGETIFGDTIHLSKTIGGPTTKTIAFPEGSAIQPKLDSNPGATISLANLPNGIYFIYIIGAGTNEIAWMRTIRKGISI